MPCDAWFVTLPPAAALVREVGAGEMREKTVLHREGEAGDATAVMSDRCRVTYCVLAAVSNDSAMQ